MKNKILVIFAAVSLVIVTCLFVNSVVFACNGCRGIGYTITPGTQENHCVLYVETDENGQSVYAECQVLDRCDDDTYKPSISLRCGYGDFEHCKVRDIYTGQGVYKVDPQTKCAIKGNLDDGCYCDIITAGECKIDYFRDVFDQECKEWNNS